MSADVVAGPALDPVVALCAVIVMAIGSTLQAAVGFGLALFAVPLLAILDPTYIPGPMLLAGAGLAVATARRDRHAIDRRGLLLALAGMGVGTVIGAIALKALVGPSLPRIIGLLVLIAVAISVAGPTVRATPVSLSAAGGVAGIMGTLSGIHGPPVALVLQNAEPAVARAMLGAFFAVAYFGSVGAMALVGLFGWDEVVRTVILLPGAALGFLAAARIAPFITGIWVRRSILGISTASAFVLLLR